MSDEDTADTPKPGWFSRLLLPLLMPLFARTGSSTGAEYAECSEPD